MLTVCAACVSLIELMADEIAPAGGESLGVDLLDDLNPDLFGRPLDAVEPLPARPDFRKRILPGLADEWLGEDVGPSSPQRALAWVERNMTTAASLLPQEASLTRAGEVQRQVVADLDELIAQLAQQCRSGACESDGAPKQTSQRSQPANKPGEPKSGQGTSPARDSTTRLGRGDPRAAEPADREELLKNLWGHLPPHAREQMLQSYSVEFLPEYEREIEQYFRRLAEEPDERRQQ
jgi:hypothetical protein